LQNCILKKSETNDDETEENKRIKESTQESHEQFLWMNIYHYENSTRTITNVVIKNISKYIRERERERERGREGRREGDQRQGENTERM